MQPTDPIRSVRDWQLERQQGLAGAIEFRPVPEVPNLASDRESVRARALANPLVARLWAFCTTDWVPFHCLAAGAVDAARVLHHERGPNIAAVPVGMFPLDADGFIRWDYPELVPQTENARLAVAAALQSEVNRRYAVSTSIGDVGFRVQLYSRAEYEARPVGVPDVGARFVGSAAEIDSACRVYARMLRE